uniref:Uncharacterized protein n=1 Tax=Arundo donax TaxID=35708 RepID=A0A0A9BEZ8_ARUDO
MWKQTTTTGADILFNLHIALNFLNRRYYSNKFEAKMISN